MGSLNMTFLAMFLLIVCGVPYSKGSGAATRSLWLCASNEDCDDVCGKGNGRCSQEHCGCANDQNQSIVEDAVKPICSTDSDCAKVCAPGCFSHNCVKGRCLCGCPNEVNESSLVKGSSDISCHVNKDCLKVIMWCDPETTRMCVKGMCQCVPW